jgi:hypothetical protein
MSISHEFAWAAGFFDGEGWVKIQSRGGDKYLGYYLRIGVGQVKLEPLLKLQKIFGGNVRVKQEAIGNRKRQHVWTLSTKQAAHALRCMMPYLVHKNDVAALALDFEATVGLTGQRVSEETQLFRKEIADKIMVINSLS